MSESDKKIWWYCMVGMWYTSGAVIPESRHITKLWNTLKSDDDFWDSFEAKDTVESRVSMFRGFVLGELEGNQGA